MRRKAWRSLGGPPGSSEKGSPFECMSIGRSSHQNAAMPPVSWKRVPYSPAISRSAVK